MTKVDTLRSTPMFSIITVCMNDIAGLKKTRGSIVEQTFSDFEWIVVDGASKDATTEFLASLPQGECNWSSEPDSGLYDAMNKGIDRSNGAYIIFLNSGDVFATNDVLERLHKVLDAEEEVIDFLYGDALEADGRDVIYKPARSHKYLWYGMFTHHQAMLYSRQTISQQRYRTEYRIAADYAFTSEFLRYVKTLRRVDFPICLFEGGGITSTANSHWRGIKEQWTIGRIVSKRSALLCLFAASLHVLKHFFRRALPSAHRRWRYRN